MHPSAFGSWFMPVQCLQSNFFRIFFESLVTESSSSDVWISFKGSFTFPIGNKKGSGRSIRNWFSYSSRSSSKYFILSQNSIQSLEKLFSQFPFHHNQKDCTTRVFFKKIIKHKSIQKKTGKVLTIDSCLSRLKEKQQKCR